LEWKAGWRVFGLQDAAAQIFTVPLLVKLWFLVGTLGFPALLDAGQAGLPSFFRWGTKDPLLVRHKKKKRG
jgi:hypothetical protein